MIEEGFPCIPKGKEVEVRLRSALVLLLAGFFGLAQASGDLGSWAEAHWEALVQADVEGLMATVDPQALVAFWGTPWAGFFVGEGIAQAFSRFFEEYQVEEAVTTRVHAEASLVVGEAVLGEGAGLLRIYLQFAEDGKIVAADYVLVGGEGVPLVDGAIGEGEYARQVEVAGAKIAWRNGAVVLFVGLSAPGTGWVALGLDRTGILHQGSHIVIAAVTPEGLWIKQYDGRHPAPFYVPSARENRDILDAAGAVHDGWTTVEFVIPLDRRDQGYRPLLPGQAYEALVAYHRTSKELRKHTDIGVFWIELAGPTQ